MAHTASGLDGQPAGARDAAFAFFGLTVVPPGEDVATYADSGRELIERLAPWLSRSKHPSYLSPDDATTRKKGTAYQPGVYERLRELKATYDPDNRLRVNHNIPPREAA